MILGMSLSAFTTLHVIISLLAIALGLVWVADLLRGRQSALIAGLFLLTTILTSVTGFMFPASAVTPAHIVGGISLVALALWDEAFRRRRSGAVLVTERASPARAPSRRHAA